MPRLPLPRPGRGADTSHEGRSGMSLPVRLGLVSYFNDCSSEVIARALPLILTAGLGASASFVGAMEGAAEAVSILLRGFSGWLSDRLDSRKPLVVGGYSCSVLARALLLLAASPWLFGLARIFDRTGKGLRTAPRDAMVADAVAAGVSGKAFGITRFLDTLGAVTGLAAALYLGLGRHGLDQVAFHRIVAYALIPGVLALVTLVAIVPKFSRLTPAKRYLSWAVPPAIRGYLAVVALFALANSSDAFLVIRAREFGFSFTAILGLLIAFNAAAALLAVPIGKLSDRWGRQPFLLCGWAVYAASYVGFAFVLNRLAFAFIFTLYGAFYGFTEGVEKALLADLLPRSELGTGYGALQLTLGLMALPSSLLTGYLMDRWGSQVAFTVVALLALLATLGLWLWWHGLRAGTKQL